MTSKMLCQLSDTVENHCGVSGGVEKQFLLLNPMLYSISFCGGCRVQRANGDPGVF